MNLCTTSEAGQNNSTLPVSNTDILKTAALNYKKLINKEYRFTVGDKKKKLSIRFVGCSTEEFTHIYGLDHLDDLTVFQNLNNSKKRAIFNLNYSRLNHESG